MACAEETRDANIALFMERRMEAADIDGDRGAVSGFVPLLSAPRPFDVRNTPAVGAAEKSAANPLSADRFRCVDSPVEDENRQLLENMISF